MKQKYLWVSILVILISFSAHAEKFFQAHFGDEPNTIDPSDTYEVTGMHVVINIFEGLTTPNSKPEGVEPGVASSWKSENKGLKYKFTLRKEAKWSNGRALVAGDFVYGMGRTLLPETASHVAYMMYAIKNAQAFNEGKIKDFSQVGIKAIDDHTLEFTLDHPVSYFVQLTATPAYFPAPQETIKKYGNKWTQPENIVVNGYFKPTKWVPQDAIETRKNPYYWDKVNVKLDGINFHHIQSDKTAERMYEGGQLDTIYQIPVGKDKYWKNKKDYAVEKLYGNYYYSLNVKREPISDLRVRKALLLSVNRDQLVNFVASGSNIPSFAMTPPTASYTPPTIYKYDLKEAKKLIAEVKAEYEKKEKPFPKITLSTNTKEDHMKIAVAVQQMWKNELGIDVTIENSEWKVFIDQRNKHNFDVARDAWIGDYQDPMTFLDQMTTGNPQNHSDWSNKKYDDLLTKASKEIILSKRTQLYYDAEKMMMEDAPIVPLYDQTWAFLISPKVKNFPFHSLRMHVFKNLDLVE